MKRYFAVWWIVGALFASVPSMSFAQTPCGKVRWQITCANYGGCGVGSTCQSSYLWAHSVDSANCYYHPGNLCPTGCFPYERFVDVCCDDGSILEYMQEVCCESV
jgi:hypothetical protein